MKTNLCFLVLLYLQSVALLAQSEAQTLFARGTNAYLEGDYASAVSHYRACLKIEQSSALHYNLGNTYALLDQPGRAILHFEKALALNPGMSEARVNLASLREVWQLPEPQQTLSTAVISFLPVNLWTWTAMAAFWIAAGALALQWLRGWRDHPVWWTAGVALGVFALAAFALSGYRERSHEGIVLGGEAPLTIAPAGRAEVVAYLPPGSLGRVEKTYQDYYYIEPVQGAPGWIHQGQFAPIWED